MAADLGTKKLSRAFKILWVTCRYRLDDFLPLTSLPTSLRLLLILAPWQLFPRPKHSKAVRLRLAIETLGPIFIKFGQLLSTRRDLLDDELANELKKLQDQVPPFSQKESILLIEKGLGRPVSEVFSRFDEDVMASASIAQVHSAQLPNGQEVIVKVIRPNIKKTIQQDLSLMKLFAYLLEALWKNGKRLRAQQIVLDYEKTIFDELDLQREAANASQIRRNFLNSELIYIPEVYWPYCNQHVLVMERIYGTPVADIETLKAHHVDLKVLAERGVEIFFTQVFRDSFFHADMHPGNIFVSTKNPQAAQYIAVDFGIVGTLGEEDQNYLARNLLAFFNRDYHEVARLHVDSGWVPSTTRVEEFEAAIRTVCEPIFERPLSEISFGQFLVRLFQTAQRFDMEVQPQLVLLQKTLINIEGLGRQLYPDLDLWSTAKPFLERWMRDRLAPPGVFKRLREQFPDLVQQSPELPKLIYETMDNLSRLEPPRAQTSSYQGDTQKPNKKRKVLACVLIGTGLISSNADWLHIAQTLSAASALSITLGAWLLLTSK
ncbi:MULTISPECIES: ubiquinone biosynthesis regulatory protein kinase UbiB [unclassified Oleiphilus]|uniref:ubiquinone biosynthesis regulatory protein kinase UbiB n=1 Tax=unclassified Oleiphilus TaxID=2631174 RepID=UPI0007C2A2CA|nr:MULTISPECIES: ubiquinone biosynthesis regulatory protein kinase UbiB [unclassified Oleiphilus]KZY65370.1 ubiquinone biosynthesis regulatory protein kinase UbiB [Oleiphilus sp. HI0066]KZY68409.1 ubiquinone biosynthesis regulatory protein kinase UbiB [Oleiphilus sp. HI0067]